MTLDDKMKMMGVFGILFIVVEFIVVFGGLGFWLYAVVHCIRNRHDSDRLMWVLITLGGGPIGAALYFAMGRQKPPPANASNTSATSPLPPTPIPSAHAWSPPPIAGPAFDHIAMQDEKKRTQAINDALSAMAASRNRR